MDYPANKRKGILLTDTEKLQAALDKEQGRAQSRVLWAGEVQKMVKYEEEKGTISIIPKSKRKGASLDLYSGTSAYTKYPTVLTLVSVTYKSGQWYVTQIRRASWKTVRTVTLTHLTPEQLAGVIRGQVLRMGIVLDPETESGVLTDTLDLMPIYLAAGPEEAKIAQARLEHGWDLK